MKEPKTNGTVSQPARSQPARKTKETAEHYLDGAISDPATKASDKFADLQDKLENNIWGVESQATWFSAFFSLVLVIICPICLFGNWIALEYFNGSLTTVLTAVGRIGPLNLYTYFGPSLSKEAVIGYAGWLVFQGLLYSLLPGPISTGQLTPAGNLLKYKTNGLNAWMVTHILFVTFGYLGVFDPAIIAKHFPGLLVAVNIYGFLLAGFALLKAHLAPTFANDRKFSGSWIHDYFVGVELNPRFGELWDFKLFHNGRPGIVAWTLISLSFSAYQYQHIGYVTNSLLLVDLFHGIYVVDFFWNESWYLRTLDMCHDHFGYYLGFGSVAIVPNLYTVQAQYLARYPVDLDTWQVAAILIIGLGGYAIFRGANYQKDSVRATGGKCNVWGKPAKFIRATYKTSDGKTHESLLLTSGWWGFSRHANYLGDMLLAFAMGASCGSWRTIPWYYTVFIVALFANRIPRDEARCSKKYGSQWQKYCEQVKYRILPGLL